MSADETTLTEQERAMIPIAAFAASGEMDALTQSIENGLAAGLTVNQMQEMLAQLYAYAGFPRSLNAMGTLQSVVEAKEEAGESVEYGPAASPFPDDYDSLENGTANQTELIGRPVSGGLYDFAPVIDEFLKAHLFGDIFQRDVLSWKERELVTIATLANLSGVNSQLGAHYFISLNNGLTPDQLKAFTEVLEASVSAAAAENAKAVLEQVLSRF
ncbi:carboxymuconolactone decarboxylase family protein [Reinekea blandensis]|uniref:carboxymuconolactone decarboxylase family protein n=1 Tax=Reinekea blandensis TaxID=374838 RepID=UPI0002E2A384|nr:carboxymuconolactone decarboxylase family protein [Reinekea blandensis]